MRRGQETVLAPVQGRVEWINDWRTECDNEQRAAGPDGTDRMIRIGSLSDSCCMVVG